MNLKLKMQILERFGHQADFAQVVGVDESLVSRIIRGRRSLSEMDKKKWARKLGCSTKEIFSGSADAHGGMNRSKENLDGKAR